MRTSASVVIIGAGIVGCGAAYHLTQLGWRDIVVIEQGPLFRAGGSTSHAPGIVFQTNGSKTICTFAQQTVALYKSLELDGEACWSEVGSLEVAQTPERLEDLKRRHGWATSWQLDSQLIAPNEAAQLLPLLDPNSILGAYYVPSDGTCKAVNACEAMARYAMQQGAEFHERTPAIGFEQVNGRICAVVTPNGRIATDRVLLCSGIWGPKIGKLAGVPVPLMPCEHQLAWTAPMVELAGETREIVHPVLRAQDKDLYFRQRRDGYAVGTYRHDPVLVEPTDIRAHEVAADMPASQPFTPETFAPSWHDAIELIPALARAEVVDAYNGMFSFTPDGNPLLGESAALGGFWLAEAIWITHAGGASKAVAEWMTNGRAELDMRECDVNRFEPYQVTHDYVSARAKQQYIEVYDVIHPLQPMEQPRPLRKSPFFDQESDLGAVFFEGGGWERPRWYECNNNLLNSYPVPDRDSWSATCWSPIAGAEHQAVRETAGLFDMTPLPKLEVSGPGASAFLESVSSNLVDRPIGSIVYSLLLDERAGVRSDVTIARLASDRFQIGCNGVLDFDWLSRHLPATGDVHLRDVTNALCCIGLWGPQARSILGHVSNADLATTTFPYFSAKSIEIGEVPVFAQRLSYVGELGYELYAPAEFGGRLWDLLWQAGQPSGLIAAGRAAFESMRLEKGYRFWGNDVHSEDNPYQAGVGFAVRTAKRDFIGRDAVIAARAQPLFRQLSCLRLERPGDVVMGKEPVWHAEQVVGYVTSAAYGFTVGAGIAYAYLPTNLATVGTRVEIEYFDRCLPAIVASDPLFDPEGVRLRV